jgi:hypothetical protein
MELPTLQPETLIALNNFLQVWKQDPIASNNLNISPQNVILWNNEEPEKSVDLTPILGNPIDLNFDEFLQFEESEVLELSNENLESTKELETTKENNQVQKIANELRKEPEPQNKSFTNPFIGGTWKDQVTRILDALTKSGRTRIALTRNIQTYYWLGKLISDATEEQEIKEFIQRIQGKRRAKDTWKGALRTYDLFELRPLELMYQLQYTTVTHIIKLTENEFAELVSQVTS